MTPLSLELKPSWLFAAVLSGAHLAAVGSMAVTLDGLPLGLGMAGVMVSGIGCVGEALLLWPGSPVALDLNEDGSGRWTARHGEVHKADKVVVSYTAAWVVVLGLRHGRYRTRWLVVPADAASRESHRSLRLWSRWRLG